jgi:hypothetical protein
MNYLSEIEDVIPFEINDYGHIILSIEFENKIGCFIFDTGAGTNLIFNKFFCENFKHKKSRNFYVGHRTTGEEVFVPLYTAKKVKINKSLFSNIIYGVSDIDILEGIDGLLSLLMFQNKIVVIDFENRNLIICANIVSSLTSLKIYTHKYTNRILDIFLPLTINQKLTIQVLIDSGAGFDKFWISERFFKTLKVTNSNYQTKKSEFKVNYINKIYEVDINSIETIDKSINLINHSVKFVENMIHEGKCGIYWLGKILAFDIKNEKIHIIKK